eukprot:1142578-Pelagomonas_calceolata.AAC.2
MSVCDISDVSEGIEGACTGTPDFHVQYLLYDVDLFLTAHYPLDIWQIISIPSSTESLRPQKILNAGSEK